MPLRILLQFFAVTIVQQSAAWNARLLDLRRYVALRSSRPLERGCLFAGRENKGWKKKPKVVKGKNALKDVKERKRDDQGRQAGLTYIQNNLP